MDPLGQGVSKIGDKITFVPKTLPGEEGEASVVSEKKGVRFLGLPEKFSQLSEKRIEPICPHFKSCPSCHFLHTDYKNELSFKKMTLERLLKTEAITHSAPERLHYRNRIQLHYNLKKEKLGYLDPATHEIMEVPSCMIGTKEISETLQSLYLEKSWKKTVGTGPLEGHLEIYVQNNKAEIHLNKPYSSGGFTQVNSSMNSLLLEIIEKKTKELSLNEYPFCVDLFGGSGNLTKNISKGSVIVVDGFPVKKEGLSSHQTFLQIDLFASNFLELFPPKFSTNIIDLLILDPPRSGFKGLKEFLHSFSVKNILYVSCNPATLTRDLSSIADKFKIKEVHLLDFFPSTYHFETLVLLKNL